ncbi:class IV adenylate cyclase [Weeksellaceae bacterium TAE3-ERU29]|nr:class IV adenylate cyclase [Weeksellaceae bacterium TAE3-ERU29]
MHIKNFEFKAKVDDIQLYESKLLQLNPKFIGVDNQVDTYFNVNEGRLKLREGNIENALINYDREDVQNSKESQIILYKHQPNIALKNILEKQLGIKVIVSKKRKIYFVDNVKFHFDEVENLGAFIEVEAIDENSKFEIDELKNQCNKYMEFFGLKKENLVEKSYSDLILEKK